MDDLVTLMSGTSRLRRLSNIDPKKLHSTATAYCVVHSFSYGR